MSALQRTVSVVVWGGGTGGVAAALQAARSGVDTVLLTPGPWLGGMVSAAGVCCPDGNELSPWQTGLWGALLRALAAGTPGGLDHNWVSCFGYRPATAEAILRGWVEREARLSWWPLARLEAVERQGDRLVALDVCWRGEDWRLSPTLVIDGSDRGDLYPLAAVPHRLGWEARETWEEPSAPPRAALESDPFFQRQRVQSPTWVAMAQLAASGEGPGVAPGATALSGTPGDSGGEPTPAAPFAEATRRFGLERTLTYGRLPGGLLMLNWPLAGNDWHEGLERAFAEGLPPGSVADDLAAEMRNHSQAFAEALRDLAPGRLERARVFPTAEDAAAGALEGAEDLALMPYWREGRRLVALDTVVERQLLPLAPGAAIGPLSREGTGRLTAIAVGNYANDHHYPGPDWPLAPKSCRWGGRWSGTPFTVPYGALVSEGVTNLLAADKAIGVSHMANGATRLQPLVLNLGQAAGLAAALCVRLGVRPAELPVRRLQEALILDPLAPAGPLPLWDTPWHHPEWRERQLALLEDPSRLEPSGRWSPRAGDPHQAPSEPGERLWRGELRGDGQGGFTLHGSPGLAGEPWPLITLEPALNDWLGQRTRPAPVALVGCANPWGPWLRVSRLA
ncbi:MAG: FAD-dependent oxidoreductase [Cyanobacteria bacterium K_Offshore_surface_m2_239]|nr:FAD-dependent oxidoreductase [Cyanobacteria bacterium K_Offshore_surface_m2_239]